MDKRERTLRSVPKVDTFHFNGERVSEWLDLVEQALVGVPDKTKFKCILQYVLHKHHPEEQKVADDANGDWAKFREGMQRKYRLGDGLLIMADLEAMNRDDFTTIGAFLQEFKKKARKVHGISEEAQCAVFLGLLIASETVELTSHEGGNAKLTWATIDRGVEVGSLDQVEQHQVRLQRQKRKERDAAGTPGVKKIITDVLAGLRPSDTTEGDGGGPGKRQGGRGGGGYPGRMGRGGAGTSTPYEGAALWQEKEELPVGVEEVGSDEEVTQRLQVGDAREKTIIIESDDEGGDEEVRSVVVLLNKMKDLLDKVGRYQRKLVDLCEEVKEWRANLPKVFLYDSGPESMPGWPGVTTVGTGPRSGMMTRPPTPQVRLAQAARTRSQAKAGASQEPPRKEPEPKKGKETVEVEDDDDDEGEDDRLHQEEDQRAEQRAKKRESRGEAEPVMRDVPPKRKKYVVRLEEGFDVERVIDRLLEGHNDLMTLKEILASAPRLRNELKGRLSSRLVPNVHLNVILPKEMEWAEPGTKMDWKCLACGVVDLAVKGSKCTAMVDMGAEINIIREADAVIFGLEIDRSDCGILHRANNKAVFCGTASNVLLEISRVKARACFFVMPDVDHSILLGRSFLCRTETLMYNKHDGSLILILCDPACGNYEVITCRNTGPRSLRNRPNPGSFTIEESEDAHRRLMAEPEEEVEGEAFSLSLSDAGKAMDIVVTHEMADPDAIQALREQVLEYPEVGEMELVYRLPKGRMDPAVVQAPTRAASQPFLGAGSSRVSKGGTKR
ncbi:hypothetical protein CBR_g24046 [Chara braunii]|uniref:Peptidase A2 domain-containing protein n=1 Tax=Chara braunii TaxID=69332 RepID=A0A388L5J6_CHABU|nr:hypothetical protein CBR_g24046 [Chara braunii]|eukprot:GBG77599.1 hypothetical protein CBR_g24046 [Chara braunii]